MNDKARQHILAALIIILLLLCVFSSFYNFPIERVKADAVPPTIIINFAGNLSDDGGPYWRPPGESDILDEAGEGVWRDGYYANNSMQQEGWIYINLTVEDGDGVPNVWLQWKNETTWTNYTYAFTNTTGGYFEYNTSGNIQTCEGYNYSFNIVANDTGGNSNVTWWNKTGLGGNNSRRWVQLNCTQTTITYTPFYFYNVTYSDDDMAVAGNSYKTKDRLQHDQGADGTTHDTGILLSAIPDDYMSIRWCNSYIGYWFDQSTCSNTTINNIYLHFWWSTTEGNLNGYEENGRGVSFDKKRNHLDSPSTGSINYYSTNASNRKSQITYDSPVGYADRNNSFNLEAKFWNVTDTGFTDNEIYELALLFQGNTLFETNYQPFLINNRSIMSFVLFNVPDNATLNASHADTDSDGLSDWNELYVTYTNPFLADTDNDGISDYWEIQSGSDPNNYTDTIENYFVKNAGDDSKDGLSDANAWETIAKVVSEFGSDISAGDNIYFNRGDTFNDAILDLGDADFPSGTSGNWMVFGAYGTGAKPIFSFTGTSEPIIHIDQTPNVEYVVIEDIHFTTNDYHCILSDIHATGHFNNLTIRRCDFDNLAVGAFGIYLRCGEYYKIENCTFDVDNTAHGIAIGGSPNNQIRDGIIRNCTITDCKDGINLHFHDTTDESVGPNLWIENCTISDWTAGESGIDVNGGDNFENILIQNCDITNGPSNGAIWVSTGTQNLVIDDVFIYDVTKNGIGISSCTNTIIRNTVIDNWDESDDNAFLTQTTGWMNNTYIYNNNFIHHAGGNIIIEFKDATEDGFIFKNNIVFSTESASPDLFVWVIGATFEAINSNWSHNMWWRGDGGSGAENWWDDSGASVTYAQWVAEAFTTGELRDNPEFADVANDNFSLNATSPCIDAGDWLTLCNGGSTGTTIQVDDAGYFFAGLPTLGVTGDEITVGTDDVTITNVNYDTNVITVTPSITWVDDDPISLRYNGSAPDIGAKEHTSTVAWSNTAPTLTNEVPANTSTIVVIYPQLNITVTDADGNNSEVYWYTNASGSWYLMQTNNTVLNATVYLLNFTNVSSYYTKYWWRVSANDTHDNTTEIYHFTTRGGTNTPTQNGEVPANGSTGIIRYPPCNITCNDLNGDSLTVYFYENTTGNWVLQQTNSSHTANTSAVWSSYANASEYVTKYWWSVNLTDGTNWTNATYNFVTDGLTIPTNLTASNPTTSSIGLEWTKGYIKGAFVHDILYVDNFTKYGGNPLFDKTDTGSWADYGIRENTLLTNSTGHIVKVDGKYVIYFSGRTYDPVSKFTRIGRATSSDGENWDVANTHVFNDTDANYYTFVGSVIQRGENDYIMYYGAKNDTDQHTFKYATSSDSITWTAQNEILNETDFNDVTSMHIPYVIYFDSEWHMVLEIDTITGGFAIYYANSSDGLSWNPKADPIYSGGAGGEWDDEDAANPSLYKIGTNKYVIFYNGNGDDVVYDFNLGVIYSSVNVTSGWTSWKNNPILSTGVADEWDDERIEGPRIYMDDVNNATLRMWYFGLPTTGSFADGAIGYAICNETIVNTMVRYSTSNNLTTYTDGSLGYDGADSYTTITGLDSDTTYYFRAWSWNVTEGWNATGSNTVSKATEVLIEWSNSDPVNSNPDPQNSNTSVSLTPTLRSQVNDVDMSNQSVNTTWWSDSSGGWVAFATNTSSSNTTFYQTFINASTYGTTYYWSTNTSDGNGGWDNDTYSFTTLVNASPSISSPSPSNGETEVGVSLSSLSVTIEDNEDTFNWTITTSPNVGSNSANGASNGSKTCSISGLSYDGYYTWTVSVTDGISWTNTTYDFTVEGDPGGGPPINSAPTVSNPYPADEATSLHITPICHVLVADANLDSIDVNFYWYNSTSQWEKMQTNSSAASGTTVYWTFSNASSYSTTYYWNVTVDDGTDNITYSYSFTTIQGNPVISTYSPADGAVDVTRNTSVSITIFDYQGNSMNITWRSNSSGTWINFGWNVSVQNGTYYQTFINSTEHNTQYWWSVNLTDGTDWTNATYSFTTKLNVAPVITSLIPRDGRRYVSIYMDNVSIMITDANNLFDYTIETDPDVGSISENNVNDGVKTCTLSGLAYSTIYTWYVNATDGESWTNASYTFTTKGDTDFDIEDFKLNLPEWAMGPYKVYVGDFVWMFLFVGVIAITWGSSKHVSSTLIVILLIFAAYGTQRVFVDNSEISLLFSVIAAICVAAIMLGLFLNKRYR